MEQRERGMHCAGVLVEPMQAEGIANIFMTFGETNQAIFEKGSGYLLPSKEYRTS